MRYVQWIPTKDVQVGDILPCYLSNATAYVTVTGWSDKYLKTSDVTHRTFTVTGAPWWVRSDNMMITSDLARETLVLGIGPAENKW